MVVSEDNDMSTRDFMEDERRAKLRSNVPVDSKEILGQDRGEILMKLDLRKGAQFMKSQCKN